MADINQFIKETNAEIEKLQAKQVKEARNVVLDTYIEIIESKPVDTGLFRHSNFIEKNKNTTAEIESPSTRKEAEALARKHDVKQSKQKLGISTTKLVHGDKIRIYNNLDYADRIETGWSKKQAPDGVYGIAEEKVRKKIGKRIVIK